MNRLRKITSFIVLITTVFISGILLIANTVIGDEVGTVSITVNKRVWEEMPDSILNSGETMENLGGEPLNGSGFTLYDVTEKYYSLLTGSDPYTAESAIEKIQLDASSSIPNYATKIGEEQFTGALENDANGTTTFTNIPLKRNDKDAVYLILETTTPHVPKITKRAAPLVLTMPMYKVVTDKNGNPVLDENDQVQYLEELNTNIQVYPKNETAEDIKEFNNKNSFDEVVYNGKSYHNVTSGDILEYSLKIYLPSNISELDSFVIKDSPNAGLTYVARSLNIDDLIESSEASKEDFNVLEIDNGFEVHLNVDSSKIQNLAGKQIKINYSMKLNTEVIPDKGIENKASIIINDDPTTKTEITPPPGVITGGKVFMKIDGHTGNSLSGAEFIVVNDAEKISYAQFERNQSGEYVFKDWVTNDNDATKLVSDKDGYIKIKGLLYSENKQETINYKLRETKAPSNTYIQLQNDIDFSIDLGSYSDSKDLVTIIKNVPKGILPSTGGKGSILYSLLGILLMIISYVGYRKTKKI